MSQGLNPKELPTELLQLIEQVVEQSKLPTTLAARVRDDLAEHFEDGLAAGATTAELAERFGDPQAVATRLLSIYQQNEDGEQPVRSIREGLRPPHGFHQTVPAVSTPWIHQLVTDARASLSSLRRSRLFSLLVIVTLALGIGASTSIFTVMDSVLLQPLPYERPQELVTLYESYDGNPPAHGYSTGMFVNTARSFEDVFSHVGTMYTYRESGHDLISDDEPIRLITTPVGAGFFEALGAKPLLGRTFEPLHSFGPGGEAGGDTGGGASETIDPETGESTPVPLPNVAVLSFDLWQNHFDSDPQIVGKNVILDGVAKEVLGVMREGFNNPFGSKADVWLAQDLRPGGRNNWDNSYLTTFARLRPGVSIDQARLRVEPLMQGIHETQPESQRVSFVIKPLQAEIVGDFRERMLWILTGAALLVLISACVNVGNLVFARGLDRERELVLRGALGSDRRGLLSLLLIENAWLAVGGAALGFALGTGATRALLAVAPNVLPSNLDSPNISWTVFGFVGVLLVASLLIFGLAPAVLLSRVPISQALNSGGRGGTEARTPQKLRTAFVVAQISVALVLMIGAGLLFRSFQQIRDASLGVDTAETLTFEVNLPTYRYSTAEERVDFHDRFHERLENLSGIVAVGATSWLPLNGRYHQWGPVFQSSADGDPLVREAPEPWSADVRVIAGDYFQAAGVPLLAGNENVEPAPDGELVAWISRQVAEQVFPGEDPVGRRAHVAFTARRIVGVVADVAVDGRGTTVPTVYIPHSQMADDRNWPLTQMVKTAGPTVGLRESVERELHSLDQGLVLFRPKLFDGLVDQARAQDRFVLLLMSVFALVAMTLVTVGTYGVLAGVVAKRKREIGIRMALGADRSDVRWSVFRSALGMLSGGIVIGSTIAIGLTRGIGSLLHGVEATDPVAFVAAILALLVLGGVASLVPALRATRVDPARTLGEG